MSLCFHKEVGFQTGAIRKEWDVAIEYIYLLPFLTDQREATPDGKSADEGAAGNSGQHRHHSEFCFLC